MATMQNLLTALKAADAAGNTADAQRIAGIIHPVVVEVISRGQNSVHCITTNQFIHHERIRPKVHITFAAPIANNQAFYTVLRNRKLFKLEGMWIHTACHQRYKHYKHDEVLHSEDFFGCSRYEVLKVIRLEVCHILKV